MNSADQPVLTWLRFPRPHSPCESCFLRAVTLSVECAALRNVYLLRSDPGLHHMRHFSAELEEVSFVAEDKDGLWVRELTGSAPRDDV